MNRLATCPDSEFFRKLLRGETLPDQIEELARHADLCPACALRVAKLTETPASPAIARLVAKCRAASGIVNTALASGESNTPSEGAVRAARAVEDALTFLSPPQGPNEIGRLGDYRVLRLLGQGGMGLVLAAEEPALKRRVALKVMKPEVAAKAQNRQRFLREAQAAAKVEHPNIVPIYQIGEANGVPFIAMPFLKGEPLDARLKHGRLEEMEIIGIGRETAEGLAAAHEQGLIHRDIKPGNIWLETLDDDAVRVKILDFGLARLSGDEANLTQSGAIMGTPAYMAPEQARSRPVDQRADLFSLGCVLYEASTGQRPFTGSDTMSILTSLALDIPTAPHLRNAKISPALSQVIMKLLEKDPAKRPQSANEVVAALKNLQSGNTIIVVARSQPIAPVDPWADIDAGSVTECALESSATPVAKPALRTSTGLSGRLHVKRAKPGARTNSLSKKWLLIGGGLAAVILLAAAGVVFLQPTDGVVRIETSEPDVEVVFDKTGPTIKGADKNPIILKAGEHFLVVKRGDLEFETDKFIVKGGATITLRIELLKGRIQVAQADKVIGRRELPPDKKPPPKRIDPVVPPPVVAKGNGALAFDGKASYVTIPSLSYSGGYPLTVEAWAVLERPPDEPKAEVVVGNPEWAGFSLGGEKKWGFGFFMQDKSTYTNASVTNPLPRNRLIHLAGVYDGQSQVHFYVDGQPQARTPAPGTHKASPLPVALGANPGTDGKFSDHFLGQITEVRISSIARYDVDFVPQRRFEPDPNTLALYHFDEGSGDKLTDSSDKKHHGTIVGARWVKIDAPVPSERRALNLLALIDVDKDVTPGGWSLAADRLRSPAAGVAVAEFPYSPPDEYDFRIEFTCIAGSKQINQFLARRDRSFSFIQGAPGNLCGLEMIDNKAVNENAAKFVRSMGLNERHVCVARVRNDQVTVELDGAELVRWKTDFGDLSLDHEKYSTGSLPGATRILRVRTNNSETIFHKAEVVEITGSGAFARPEDPAAKKAAEERNIAKAPAPGGRAINLLAVIDLMKDHSEGNWSVVADGLKSVRTGKPVVAELPYSPPDEYDFRIEFTCLAGSDKMSVGNIINQFLVHRERSFFFLMGTQPRSSFGLGFVDGQPAGNNPTTFQRAPLTLNERHVCIAHVRNGLVTVDVDGAELVRWKTDYSDLSLEHPTIKYWAQHRPNPDQLAVGAYDVEAVFHKAEVVEISGPGAFARPDDPAVVAGKWLVAVPELKPLQTFHAKASGVAFSADGVPFAAAGKDGLQWWDPKTFAPRPKLSFVPEAEAGAFSSSVAFSRDGKFMAVGGEKGVVNLFGADGKLLKELADHTNGVWALAFSTDGKFLAAGSGVTAERDNCTVKVWRVPDGTPLPLLADINLTNPYTTIEFSPDGRYVAAGSWALAAFLWDLQTPNAKPRVLPGKHSVNSIAFSPDSKTLFTSCVDGKVRRWDPAEGKLLAEHDLGFPISRLGLSPDGRVLAVGGDKGVLRLVAADSFAPLANLLLGHESSVWSCAFSADGTRLLTSDGPELVHIWDVSAFRR